jgi:hypothetical protein
MSTVEEIKAAIKQLRPADQNALLQWINEWADDEWDRQIKRDLQTGGLDAVLRQARADIAAGKAREMP